MSFEFADDYTKLSSAAFTSIRELGEITAKTYEQLIQQNIDLFNTFLQASAKQVSLLSESKGYKELLSGEANLVAEYNQTLLDNVRKTAEIITGSKDEVTSWLEKGFEAATPIKKAVATAAKKAA